MNNSTTPAKRPSLVTPQAPAKRALLASPMEDFMTHPLDALFTAVTQPAYNFKPVATDFNGYMCHFLKEAVSLKITSTAMCLTRNDSVGVFRMPILMKRRLQVKVEEILQSGLRHAGCANGTVKTRSPFTNLPMFFRYGPTTQVFDQKNMSAPAEPVYRSDLRRGTCFVGRMELEMNGFKFDRDGSTVSPMIRVRQIFKMAPIPGSTAEPDPFDCTLEDPLTDEDGEEEEAPKKN
jgi:hypothetical protein